MCVYLCTGVCMCVCTVVVSANFQMPEDTTVALFSVSLSLTLFHRIAHRLRPPGTYDLQRESTRGGSIATSVGGAREGLLEEGEPHIGELYPAYLSVSIYMVRLSSALNMAVKETLSGGVEVLKVAFKDKTSDGSEGRHLATLGHV